MEGVLTILPFTEGRSGRDNPGYTLLLSESPGRPGAMKYTTATVRFFLLLGLFCSWTLPARTQPGEKETLERRLAAAKDASPDALLNTVQELAAGLTEQVGRQLKEALKDEGFFDQGEEYRFVAAALALTRKQDPGLRKLGLTSALVLARKAASKEIRALSIRLLGESGELGRVKSTLADILEEAVKKDKPRLLIAASLALDRLDNTGSRLPLLRLVHDTARGFAIRSEAALAIARMTPRGALDPIALAFIRKLSGEQSERGALARLLFERAARLNGQAPDILDQLEKLQKENAQLARRIRDLEIKRREGPGDALEEFIDMLRGEFVDPAEVNIKTLASAAFRALVDQLDFSTFLSPADLDRARRRSAGRQLGLGAEFFKLDRLSPLIVARTFPRKNDTGTRKGLHAGDRVVALAGESTSGLGPEDIRGILGNQEPGEPVQVEIERWGQAGNLNIVIQHGPVETPALFSELLPEAVAYVRVSRFGSRTAESLGELLTNFSKRTGGLKGFILDLRGNSGGLLEEAVKIVDLLVDDAGSPIVSQVSSGGRPGREYKATAGRLITCPAMILVDGWSASSSEVVAGALQDLKRATIIGTRTYGKGVSQQRLDVPASVNRLVGGKASVQLANFYLQLPSGRRFHGPRDSRGRVTVGRRGGIEPDVIVADPLKELASWEQDELLRVQYSTELYEYLNIHYEHLEFLWQEAPRDLTRAEDYPEFLLLYSSLATSLSEAQVCAALHRLLHRKIEDEKQTEFANTLHADIQLQTAIAELGITVETHPSYARWLPDKIQQD